eukprot:TRINITY_DN23648_c0_g1_i1.p1 TRINITY_DN23648_c0_g1~~TRINITY_DN23648_c0_g1_i1.p1  ORF type:complete len:869 (-),score=166.06 TRINITY_DN23648_c0_g1_i1:366-2972(-)
MVFPTATACSQDVGSAADADGSPTSSWEHPPSFYCPISQQCMHDPVVLCDGHTYERRHIERWLRSHNSSPVSGAVLPQKDIFPNHALRNAIEEYFQQIFSVHRRAIRRNFAVTSARPQQQQQHQDTALVRTIDALMQCSLLMNADLDTERVLRRIMNEARALLGAEVASVFLVDSARGELFSTVNSTGGELRIPITAGIAGHVATSGEPVMIRDAYNDSRFNKDVDTKTRFKTRNMMCVPLKLKRGTVIGIVQLINKSSPSMLAPSDPRNLRDERSSSPELRGDSAALTEEAKEREEVLLDFTSDDLHFLQVFAAQAATAISNSGALIDSAAASAAGGTTTPLGREESSASVATPKARGAAGVPAVSSSASLSSSEAACGAGAAASALCTGFARLCRGLNDGSSGSLRRSHVGEKAAVMSNFKVVSEGAGLELAPQLRTPPASSEAAAPSSPTAVAACKVDGASGEGTRALLEEAFAGWRLDAETLSEATGGRPLSSLGTFLFERLGFISHFGLDPVKVEKFFIELECGYDNSHAYHNRKHAASVLHLTHAILEHGGLMRNIAESSCAKDCSQPEFCAQGGHLERMACLLAAAVHDYEHLGATNDLLVKTSHARALRYNDRHVNEHHHVASAFSLLRMSAYNFLDVLPAATYRRLRELVIELVLGTDMAVNSPIVKSLTDVLDKTPAESCADADVREDSVAFSPATRSDAVLLLKVALKCADLGHLTLDWEVHKLWVSRLEVEFFAQGDREKELGLPVSFLMDRCKPGASATQKGFFDFIALPLFNALVRAVPASRPLLKAVEDNYQRWIDPDAASAIAKEQLSRSASTERESPEMRANSARDTCDARPVSPGEREVISEQKATGCKA